jgi:hypothetical protein
VHLLVPWRQSAVVKDCHLEPVLSLDDGFSYCLDPGVELAMVQLRQSPESFGWEGLVARTHEESFGATVHDVSNPADAAGYDLLSRRPDGEERCIEVKGRRAIGDVQLSENEWAKAANLRERYWLYVVYDCAALNPRLLRIQDPFLKLIVQARGGVIVDEQAVFQAAEE